MKGPSGAVQVMAHENIGHKRVVVHQRNVPIATHHHKSGHSEFANLRALDAMTVYEVNAFVPWFVLSEPGFLDENPVQAFVARETFVLHEAPRRSDWRPDWNLFRQQTPHRGGIRDLPRQLRRVCTSCEEKEQQQADAVVHAVVYGIEGQATGRQIRCG